MPCVLSIGMLDRNDPAEALDGDITEARDDIPALPGAAAWAGDGSDDPKIPAAAIAAKRPLKDFLIDFLPQES
jgi:hypothetical protein